MILELINADQHEVLHDYLIEQGLPIPLPGRGRPLWTRGYGYGAGIGHPLGYSLGIGYGSGDGYGDGKGYGPVYTSGGDRVLQPRGRNGAGHGCRMGGGLGDGVGLGRSL